MQITFQIGKFRPVNDIITGSWSELHMLVVVYYPVVNDNWLSMRGKIFMQLTSNTGRQLLHTSDLRNLLSVFLICFLLTGCTDRNMTWQDIVASGKLRFVTVENPVTYYNTPSGPAGFEYELARRFADDNDLELQVLIAETAYDAISMVRYGKAAIAGAALIETDLPGNLAFGPAYYTVPLQLIYRNGGKQPGPVVKKNDDTSINQFMSLKEPYRLLPVTPRDDIISLVQMVQNNKIESTVANAHMVDAFRHLYPDIRVARDLTNPQPVAWVYHSGDELLDNKVREFFRKIDRKGQLAALIDQHFGHIAAFDYVDTATFIRRIKDRLPLYEPVFRKVAEKYDLDWTLLAAMSYQESHWDADARSPTGVRGLMMLTRTTAELVGISDRLNPEQSIEGGARYYLELLDKVPDR
ncbi:MAG TPA: transporter substrate-binding domain-containing protein, partial [Gammaproteobacteria bacterium]|nr:transporter substrate-binding domain-containing protein [Gammaproteobacteria bacterium]